MAFALEACQIHPRGKSTCLRMEFWGRRGPLSSTAETHGSIMDLRSIKTLRCFYLYLQEIHKKNDQKRSKTIKNDQKRSKIIKNSFFKPENGQVVNFAPENRPSCATDQQAVSQWRQLITRASGGDEVGKERKALEQLPKVLQTQRGTDELIRGIIPKWPNLKKVYESL